MSLERATIRVAEAARSNDPIGDASFTQVDPSGVVARQPIAIQHACRIHHQLLLEREPIPATLVLVRLAQRRRDLPRWRRRYACEPTAGFADAGQVFV